MRRKVWKLYTFHSHTRSTSKHKTHRKQILHLEGCIWNKSSKIKWTQLLSCQHVCSTICPTDQPINRPRLDAIANLYQSCHTPRPSSGKRGGGWGVNHTNVNQKSRDSCCSFAEPWFTNRPTYRLLSASSVIGCSTPGTWTAAQRQRKVPSNSSSRTWNRDEKRDRNKDLDISTTPSNGS